MAPVFVGSIGAGRIALSNRAGTGQNEAQTMK
jgi:hypothetical protein